MRMRIAAHAAALAFVTMALAGCAGASTPAGAPASGSGSSPAAGSGEAGSAGSTDLTTGKTALGTIVVDGKGRTVYYFDKDVANSGKSACYAGCDAAWPPVVTTATTPKVDGVSAPVGVITRTDGSHQVTVNGLPVYTYAPDSGPGAVSGQGVQGIWWVLTPKGDKVTTAAPASSSSGGY